MPGDTSSRSSLWYLKRIGLDSVVHVLKEISPLIFKNRLMVLSIRVG